MDPAPTGAIGEAALHERPALSTEGRGLLPIGPGSTWEHQCNHKRTSWNLHLLRAYGSPQRYRYRTPGALGPGGLGSWISSPLRAATKFTIPGVPLRAVLLTTAGESGNYPAMAEATQLETAWSFAILGVSKPALMAQSRSGRFGAWPVQRARVGKHGLELRNTWGKVSKPGLMDAVAEWSDPTSIRHEANSNFLWWLRNYR